MYLSIYLSIHLSIGCVCALCVARIIYEECICFSNYIFVHLSRPIVFCSTSVDGFLFSLSMKLFSDVIFCSFFSSPVFMSLSDLLPQLSFFLSTVTVWVVFQVPEKLCYYEFMCVVDVLSLFAQASASQLGRRCGNWPCLVALAPFTALCYADMALCCRTSVDGLLRSARVKARKAGPGVCGERAK